MTTGVTSASSCHTHALLPMVLQLFLFSTLPSHELKKINSIYVPSRRVFFSFFSFRGQLQVFVLEPANVCVSLVIIHNPFFGWVFNPSDISAIGERRNHCAHVVKVSSCRYCELWATWQMRNLYLFISLLHAIVSLPPLHYTTILLVVV